MFKLHLLLAGGLAFQTAVPASLAQEQENHTGDIFVITVTARRGAAAVEPEFELGPQEIDSYGASTIGEVLSALQDDLLPGEPTMMIVNGRPVANSGIYSGFPTDAIERVEILLPEAGGIIARNPAARVVNLVVSPNFLSSHGDLRAGMPTAGGTMNLNAGAKGQQIVGMNVNRYNVESGYQSILMASARPDVVASFPERSGSSLREQNHGVSGSVQHQRQIGAWSLSASAQAGLVNSRSLFQRNRSIEELRGESREISSNISIAGALADWGVRAKLDGSFTQSNQSGFSVTEGDTASVRAEITADRIPFSMPAGAAQLNLSAGAAQDWSRTLNEANVDTELARSTAERSRNTSRWTLSSRLQLPLFEKTEARVSLAHLGKLDLNLGVSLNGSSAGGGHGGEAQLVWQPWSKVRFLGQWSTHYSVPDSDLLATERTLGNSVTVYDFATGQTVQVDQILGGNPNLLAPRRDNWSVSFGTLPVTKWRISGNFRLSGSRQANQIGRISEVSPAMEAVFPDNFTRDDTGQLIAIDRRPVNFSAASDLKLVVGARVRIPLAGTDRRFIGVSTRYTRQLESRTRLRGGLVELDRLAGDGAGVPRHAAVMDLHYQNPTGWSVNASLDWQNRYRIREAVGANSPDDLIVKPPLSLDLRFERRFRVTAFPEGTTTGRGRQVTRMELTFEIINMLDARRTAVFASGLDVPGYHRDLIDPLGRMARVHVNYRF